VQKDKYIPRYTYADYALWEGDWELIGGHPYAMAPSPFGPHQRFSAEAIRLIGNELHTLECTCQVFADLDWIIDDETVVGPDVMIVCGKPIEKHLEYAPAWVLEILSTSTAFRDQIVKKELYAEQGVKYYLMADTSKKAVTTYELINGEYQIKTDGRFDLTDHCFIDLDIDGLMTI
jgi:Uma2 family endonuclease